MHKIKLEQFEGPLDLLLNLIEEEDLDITKISLAKIADDYLAYLDQIEEIRPAELADFLTIAARLLYIKSKALLPYLKWQDDDEGDDLAKQLKLYKEFLEASKKIQQLLNKNHCAFPREKTITPAEVFFSPPTNLNQNKLANLFKDVLSKLDPIFKLPRKLIEKTISLKEKIAQIKDWLITQKKTTFNELLDGSQNRADIVINFLAILELVKQKEVIVEQKILFEEIIIEKF